MRVLIILLISFISFSCSSIKNLAGTSYKYESKNRTLELKFIDSSICILKNNFHCNDLNEDIKELKIVTNYKRHGDTIFLKNIDCKKDTCKRLITISIPPQESIPCYFLNKKSRIIETKLGPAYATDYEKYGLIPNIDIDTLFIYRKKIAFYKSDSFKNIGFIFR